jgi:hypothetical protein
MIKVWNVTDKKGGIWMADRAKVITDVEEAIKILSKADEPTFWLDFVRVAVENALKLLIAQEPVEPIRQWDDDETTWWYSCGSCVQAVDYKDKYCRHCGKGLKWG